MWLLANPLARAVAGFLMASAVIAGAYAYGRSHGYHKAALEAAEGTIRNADTFNEGASNPGGDSWFRRLFPSDTD